MWVLVLVMLHNAKSIEAITTYTFKQRFTSEALCQDYLASMNAKDASLKGVCVKEESR